MGRSSLSRRARRLEKMLEQVAYTEAALSHYDLGQAGVVPTRRGFRVTAGSRTFLLRRFTGTPGRLAFVHQAALHLEKAGFTAAPRFVLTREGLPYCAVGGDLVCVTTWPDGTRCDFATSEHADAAAATLAEFHLRSAGFPERLPPDVTPKVRWGEWRLEFPRLIAEMDALVSDGAPPGGTGGRAVGVNRRIRELWSYFRGQALAATSMLDQARYGELVEEARVRRTLGHRAYRPRHLVVDAIGRVHLTDLDQCALDGPASDLAALLRRASRWNFGTAVRVLQVYHSVNPLSWYQVSAVLAALMFPSEFVRTVLRAERARSGRRSEQKLEDGLARISDEEPRRSRFLEEFMEGLAERRNDLRGRVASPSTSPSPPPSPSALQPTGGDA